MNTDAEKQKHEGDYDKQINAALLAELHRVHLNFVLELTRNCLTPEKNYPPSVVREFLRAVIRDSDHGTS
ncbi:hypothetical protein KTD26_26660 [Burkholderia multivorans]|uniref:hypothetical protein n=1 Tax=Burkholderia cepacia complex TaxID=87882 RepID=UPI000A82C357|nr:MULTISPECIES: hypothetical protein [Burkholderia cepacia complex]MBU9146099.1 hypothetical protein [Burkholderia multivorans]HEF4772994.1 hypothetical protein [Burkholderia multivorans]